jgi:hypothetical protein
MPYLTNAPRSARPALVVLAGASEKLLDSWYVDRDVRKVIPIAERSAVLAPLGGSCL